MNYEAIRAFAALDPGVIDDIVDRQDRPGYRNTVVFAAQEAVGLPAERDRAVELLKKARGKLSVSWDEAMDLVGRLARAEGRLEELEAVRAREAEYKGILRTMVEEG